MLWHMGGEKGVWIHTAMNSERMPQHLLEGIYAGEIDEDLPYRSEFDQHVTYHRLQSSQAASWPHNTPHRMINIGMNVSLITRYYTPAVYWRHDVQLANRFILGNAGFKHRSMRKDGIRAASKRISCQRSRRLGGTQSGRNPEYRS